jgi:hypothetical protein
MESSDYKLHQQTAVKMQAGGRKTQAYCHKNASRLPQKRKQGLSPKLS